MSFVQGLYPAFSQRKECLPGASFNFAGVYPTLSPSTNTSARYGTELTLTTPVGTSGADGGGDGVGGAGGAAVAFSGAAAGVSSKPIMECVPSSFMAAAFSAVTSFCDHGSSMGADFVPTTRSL